MMMRAADVAFLADGRLYLCEADGGTPRLVESAFVQQVLDRQERDRERDQWKDGSFSWGFSAARPGMAMAGLGGLGALGVGARPARFTAVTGGSKGELLYGVATQHSGGLFCQDIAQSAERRLFHRQQFEVRDLCTRGSDGMIAFSMRKEDGSAHLGLMAAEGRGVRQITEGDAVDENPSWAGSGDSLVYQSAGIARTPEGFAAALGPYCVHELDVEGRGGLSTLLEDPRFDYLAPRKTEDGALYCIRRPYKMHGQMSPLQVAQDVVLFPFRLGRAVVHFLDAFSMIFSRKPLITAGGPEREGPDQRFMMLWGNVVDVQKARRQKKLNGALVPQGWELLRWDGNEERVLARSVVSFDVCADGSVVWTNGTRIFRQEADGTEREICEGSMIERVVVVE